MADLLLHQSAKRALSLVSLVKIPTMNSLLLEHQLCQKRKKSLLIEHTSIKKFMRESYIAKTNIDKMAEQGNQIRVDATLRL